MTKFISNNFNLKEQKDQLNILFRQADSDNNGMLSYNELLETLREYFGDNEARLQVVRNLEVIMILYL